MKAILNDVTRCRGCMRCVEACAEDNHLYANPREARFDPGDLCEHRFTTVSEIGGRNVRRQCMHCVDPACAAACLVGALTKTPEGPVLYDASKCIGCRYCMISCPYTALRYRWQDYVPFMRKCDLCHDRPGGPACVEACPYEATVYGDRDELIRMAKARIKANPGTYLDRIFGETEAGGTCVLYLSDVPLDFIPTSLGSESIPEMTLPFAESTPFLGLGVASFLIGASWVLGRRNKLADERKAAATAAVKETGEDED